MEPIFQRMCATTMEDLYQIGEILHDEPLDLERICHDKLAGTLEIPFQRVWHDGPRRVIKRRLIYRIEEVEVLRCSLRFSNVIAYRIEDRANVGTYSFNRFRYDENQRVMTLDCCPECELIMSVQGIQAEYIELEYRGKCKIVRGRCWDEGPSEVYDE